MDINSTYICPKCGSEDTYYSKKKKAYICEDCDFVFEEPFRPKTIFFSYAHDENEWLVKKIKEDVERHGHSVWIDRHEIKEGDDWRASITNGLLSSNGVVSFLSKHSVRVPGVCLDELRIALSSRFGNIKTVLLEGEKDVSPPSSISNIQWLDLSSWKSELENKLTWDTWYQKKIEQLCAILDKDEFSTFTGEVEKIQKLLSVCTSDSKEQILIRKQFIGRKWLRDKVEEWRSDPQSSPMFILLGSPGIGKSAFAANELHYNPNVLCGIFCEWDKDSQKDAKNLLKTLAFKLSSKLPDYRRMLLKKFECRGEDFIIRLTAREIFEQLIIQPLNELIDGKRDIKFIIIDGLDEAGNGDENEFALLLSRYATYLPPWFKILATSRPESNIKNLFQKFTPYEYYPTSDYNIEDIAEYIKVNISKDSEIYNENLLAKILSECQGNFLYASLFLENVNSGVIDITNFEAFPKGLEAIYHQNFLRIFPSEKDYILARKILELILASDKMPVEMICDILNISLYDFISISTKFGSLIVEAKIVYTAAKSYKYYTFFHKSIRDWLVDEDKNKRFFIDVTNGYNVILRYFISNIKKNLPENSDKNLNEFMDSYIRNNIIAFFIKCNDWKRLACFLEETDTPLFPYWRCLTLFPKNIDTSRLYSYLWKHTNRDIFFRMLQRSGETQYIIFVLNYYKKQYGIDSFSENLFEIFVDVVHLRGGYQESVSLYDEYLSKYNKEEIYHNSILIHYFIRKLHHMMFYSPVENLIEEAIYLYDKCKDNILESDLNELLFLIGGNLGLLLGDLQLSEKWLKKCENLASKLNSHDFKSRAARKRADLLMLENKPGKAKKIIEQFISLNFLPNTRYEIYLFGSLGEIYRILGNYKNAEYCFNKLLSFSNDRGIMGWAAHAHLALAHLVYYITDGHDKLHFAFEHLEEAIKIYNNIGQKWGQVNSSIVKFLLISKYGKIEFHDLSDLKLTQEIAKKYNYKREFEIIDKIIEKQHIQNQLLFL